MTPEEVKAKILEDLKGLPEGRYYKKVSSGLGKLFREMEQGGLIKIAKIPVEGRKHRITQVIAMMEKADG